MTYSTKRLIGINQFRKKIIIITFWKNGDKKINKKQYG
jgi:hypothetical protein